MKRVLNVILIVAIIFQFVPKETMAMSSVTGLEIVGGIDLYDENGMLLVDDYFRSNTIKASAVVKNSSTQECSVMLVIAYYEATLVDVEMKRINLNAGSEATVSADITISVDPQKNSTAMVFLWNVTDDQITPICEARRLSYGIQTDIYVSAQNGDDRNDGTAELPLASLKAAQEKVRRMNDSMNSDINVHIESGTYILKNTWNFTDEDSGRNGHKVNYIADGDVTISGGEKVTGWELTSDGIYKAAYAGDSLVREMYVDGIKVKLSEGDTAIKPLGFYTQNGKVIASVNELSDGDKIIGVAVDDAKYAEYENKGDIQAYYARGWKVYISTVTDIVKTKSGSAFIMGDEFAAMITRANHPVNSDSSFIIKNAKELLDETGEFYYDSEEKYIYYKSESIPTNVFVSVIEQLVNVEGKDLGHQAENITFSGIRFANCAWNYPATNGFIGMQSQLFGGESKPLSYVELGNTIVDAGVQIKKANNISFTNNEFTGIAKVGVGLYYGASDNKIEGNTFYSLGDSAVTVGLPSDNYTAVTEDKEYTGYNLALNKICTSTNSPDSQYPAYRATDGRTATGWSLEPVNGDHSKAWWQVDLGGEYEIDRIEIDDRGDANQKGSRQHFKILASNDPEFITGVVTLADVSGEAFGYKETWKKEITDKDKYRYVRVQKKINEYMYLAEIRIINESMIGLPSDNYTAITEDKEYAGYNLALNKICTSTNSPDSQYPAYRATDGRTATGWSLEPVNGDHSKAWWQVDLGGEYEIDRIEIDDRGDANQEGSRQYFKILASNDPDFKTDVVTLANVAQEEFGFKETWKKEITDKDKYRYVRAQKTINEYMYLAEIRIINESMTVVPYKSVCANNKIYNNCITAIGEFNQSAPGIQTYYTDNVDIAYNYIYNVPSTGIAMGWGWEDYPDSVTSRNNKIRNNHIDNWGLLMIDNGAIYTLGQQPDSVITGNYIANQNNVYGAIYPDQGSAQYTVSENVMENVWTSMFVSEKSKKNLKFTDNWATTDQSQMYGVNTTETNTQYFIPGNMPEKAKNIADNAGLQSEFKDNVLKVKISNSVLSDEQIYANVLGEVSGHMSDSKFLKYYLQDIIKGANKIYDISLSDSAYSNVSRENLKAAIDAAQNKYNSLKAKIDENIKQNDEMKYTAIINRMEVLETKKSLETAVNEFANSKTTN